jgi:5'-3' exonuclease
MIALSLLCGCDYDEKGVIGIGKETAINFLQTLDDSVVLDRYLFIYYKPFFIFEYNKYFYNLILV